MFNLIFGFAVARLRERSTWAGLISTLAVHLGIHFSGQQQGDLINFGLAFVAVVVAFVPEKPADHRAPAPFI